MTSNELDHNPYTHGPIGRIYVVTALPIIAVMATNGLLTIADAIFLGFFVGPAALGAVTVIFPIVMLLVALATLVSAGMASVLARQFGGGLIKEARDTFWGAHGLGLAVCALVIVIFVALGRPIIMAAANGQADLADMANIYLAITIAFSPVAMVLGLNSDALRVEGRVGFMAGLSLLTSLGNIGFNYVLIAVFGLGVAGSALGTIAAQACALLVVLGFRIAGRTRLRLDTFSMDSLGVGWTRYLALGAPQSLTFIGLALGSGVVIAMVQRFGSENYETTVAAYGVINRTLSLSFLVLLGLSQTLQAIAGNNYGAGLFERSDAALRLSIGVALAFSLTAQALLFVFRDSWGYLFVDDPLIAAEVGRILPIMTAAYLLVGPQVMIVGYFQAIGNARRTALLGLARSYAFALPLTLALPWVFGETGIWIASPVAEVLLAGLTAVVLARAARADGPRLGLFMAR
ncbi:MATE family efflux transporter [Pelagibacterium xiamenense]|uniref:MATE family efflux transporter n=1 Tax=Pelagibacterium xiamenense TaxID=2901140 RepID=UPI001E3F3C4F|nr:MATE family efflux transporter [Pelagibacterium xiamenense]MCD7060144.1 MATE family efflux transporter [Pelagibacterium xiamenense]